MLSTALGDARIGRRLLWKSRGFTGAACGQPLALVATPTCIRSV